MRIMVEDERKITHHLCCNRVDCNIDDSLQMPLPEKWSDRQGYHAVGWETYTETIVV
jgi:hypothetical protein